MSPFRILWPPPGHPPAPAPTILPYAPPHPALPWVRAAVRTCGGGGAFSTEAFSAAVAREFALRRRPSPAWCAAVLDAVPGVARLGAGGRRWELAGPAEGCPAGPAADDTIDGPAGGPAGPWAAGR